MLILKTLTLEPLHGYGIGVRLEQISEEDSWSTPGHCSRRCGDWSVTA